MISCVICHKPFNAINKRHLSSHSISREEYIAKFPEAPLQSKESSERKRLAAIARQLLMSPETKALKASKIAASRIGKSSWNKDKGGYKLERSEEAKARVKARGAHNKGIPATERQKLKQSEIMLAKFASGELIHWNLGNATSAEVRQKISASNLGKLLTPEQKAKQIESLRVWVESLDYKNARSGIAHMASTKTKISNSVIKNYGAIRKSQEDAGYWIPLSQLPEVVKFRREVWKITNKNAKLIPNYDASRRGLNSLTEDNYQVDHRLSIIQGWLDGITPEQMSHPANLRFIPWRENLAKWHRSDLTKDELLALCV
jgi:hypothetical protein